ncbi:MAG: RHS repeat domain-containing protein [Anaerolineaceae bacterium]
MRGRITSETRVINGQTFTTQWAYNSADQVTQMLYPDGEYLTFSYLPQGGVNRIGAYLTGTKVNANGQISLRTFGNGTQTSLTYGDWLNNGGRLSGLQSGQSASLLNLEFTYDSVGNILTITDQLNSSQVQTFGYDALNRLTSASTNGIGQGQYSQSYSYDPATGNLASKSDVGVYTYSPSKPHAVTSAGPSAYTYDANGNMISRNGQPISYDAENHLTAFAGKTYLYDGDGNRVAEINADGTATIFIGNYFEGAYPEPEPPPQPPQPPQPLKFYMPFVSNAEEATDLFEPITARMGTLYFYADGQRIAMKKDGVVSCIYGDQLGSVSAVADADGNLISKTLYHPWGTTRYAQGISPTDYGYTGQMKEGDIYFYNARWYDPQLGRFMQADTFVPTAQGTQAWDRFAYVNNNPMRYTDPSGHWISNTNLLMHDGGGGSGGHPVLSYNGQKAASYMGSSYTQYPGSQCTTAVSSAIHYGGLPMTSEWNDSIASPAWYRTQTNFEYWTINMEFDFFESSDLPPVYDPLDMSRRESVFTSQTLKNEINKIASKIQIGDLVYYMDPYSYSENGKPVYTHVAMIVDITEIDGNTVPLIMEVDGPPQGYNLKDTVLPRSIYDTPNVHIQKIAIVFIGR